MVWEEGREQQAAPTRWTLKCEPDAGTLPKRSAACDRLERLARPFALTPKNMACTDIYGGPQEARITGTHDGRRVWVTLSARNGCEIARWNRVKFLLGGMSAGA
jgi:Subtilisin inhibitor-like